VTKITNAADERAAVDALRAFGRRPEDGLDLPRVPRWWFEKLDGA
jgi:hypothetical protein